MNEFLADSKILEAVMELGIGHLDGKLFKGILLFGEVDHSHEVEPSENFI